MWRGLPLFPPQASTYATREDALFFYLVAVTVVFVVLIFALITYFSIRYRRRSPEQRARHVREPMGLEIAWSVIPFALMVVMFVWGAWLYFYAYSPPPTGIEIAVVAKQWMWKFQHPEGLREINQLHVPVGVPIKLSMTSEDVIHSFFVPAFRVKRDVVPGRYNAVWFQATRIGSYHLFCAQYCGTGHAGMTGEVVVMSQPDYERWLQGGGAALVSPVAAGEALFHSLGCVSCHVPDNSGRAPSLVGVFGQPVKLTSGQTVTADEAYVRESILTPQAKIVNGYGPIMPTFKGLVSEEQLLDLIAYIKSLQRAAGPQAKP
jgi:cytochrome c oxidase subunit 2